MCCVEPVLMCKLLAEALVGRGGLGTGCGMCEGRLGEGSGVGVKSPGAIVRVHDVSLAHNNPRTYSTEYSRRSISITLSLLKP